MLRSTGKRSLQSVKNGVFLVRNRKTLWHMLRETMRGNYKMSVLTLMVMIISIAYMLFPFDLLPDFIPVIGWLDDGLVFYILMRRVMNETHRFNRFKAMERKNR
jgi:uncharacterized membrane protein YkvA (DUF1232 family)